MEVQYAVFSSHDCRPAAMPEALKRLLIPTAFLNYRGDVTYGTPTQSHR